MRLLHRSAFVLAVAVLAAAVVHTPAPPAQTVSKVDAPQVLSISNAGMQAVDSVSFTLMRADVGLEAIDFSRTPAPKSMRVDVSPIEVAVIGGLRGDSMPMRHRSNHVKSVASTFDPPALALMRLRLARGSLSAT